MTLPLTLSTIAFIPLKVADNCFIKDATCETVAGKLLLILQSIISAIALPLILTVGCIEIAIRACTFQGLNEVGKTIVLTATTCLVQLLAIIQTPLVLFLPGQTAHQVTNSLLTLNRPTQDEKPKNT